MSIHEVYSTMYTDIPLDLFTPEAFPNMLHTLLYSQSLCRDLFLGPIQRHAIFTDLVLIKLSDYIICLRRLN